MVTRKPVAAQSESGLPYPTTPPGASSATAARNGAGDASTNKDSSGFDLIDMEERHAPTRRDSDISSHGTWDSDDADEEEEEPEDYVEVPKPLNIRHSQLDLAGAAKKEDGDDAKQTAELPAVLRPGPGGKTVAPRRSQEMARYDEEAQDNPWRHESKNPYLRQNSFPEQSQPAATGRDTQPLSNTIPPNPWDSTQHPQESSHFPPPAPVQAPAASFAPPVHAPPAPPVAPIAPTAPTAPTAPPPPPPAPQAESAFIAQPPVDGVAKLSVAGETPASPPPAFETAEVLAVPQQGQPPLPPVTTSPSAEALAFPSNNPWRMPSPTERTTPQYPFPADVPPQSPQSPPQPQYEPPPGPPPGFAGPLIDHEEPSQAQSPPQQPPRPTPIATQASALRSSDSVPETPGARAKRQRNEHYQIKHVNWFDRTAMRQSPILTQNANGPCPLLALVNALVLSTPPNLNTALVETLKSREQVSLGLLLDAVFDELMSGRRGDTAHELPDVSELYSFLLALHTGMNVNPRFVTQAATPRGSFDGHPPELHGVHPMHRSQEKPGCFEETREMRLYSTFNIPLIHGWTPFKDSAAYNAFERNAQTFEDAQNIQFLEPELEDKRRHEGLGPEEQQSLQDIKTMKQFLANWPTQLTEHGLETISASMMPGQIAILFRNDHFSTLYKEPRHGALMTLVTDAGYGSHAEIVWESLVDVNGAASEMFSGDFRLVSHAEDARMNHESSSTGRDEAWNRQDATQSHYAQPSGITGQDELPPPLPGPRPPSSQNTVAAIDDAHDTVVVSDAQRKAAEQEDHDLALALQLQEEEEDRQRQDEERRRREQHLSEQFLENEERPPVPPRRGGARGSIAGRGGSGANNSGGTGRGRTTSATTAATTTSVRPGVNRPVSAADPDAPPSYEQAASDQVYRPAGSTAPTQGNPLNAYEALRRQQSAYAQQSSASVNAPPYSAAATSAAGRRRSDANRIRRRSSGMGNLSTGPPTPGGRVSQAATLRDAQDDRCVLM